MQQIINFFIRNKNGVLFLLLLLIGFVLTVQSHSYHRSKFSNSARWLFGGIYETNSNIKQYFHLKTDNRRLVEENMRLRQLLFNGTDTTGNDVFIDTSSFKQKYVFRGANVIKNSYSAANNVLTIDKGSDDGIAPDMGVITSEGIVGVVNRVSANYATVISVLNTTIRINAKHRPSGEIGSLTWNTKDHRLTQLIDVPKLANIKENDTIITGGESTIFPEGIPIGSIKTFSLQAAQNYYDIDVALFNAMTHIGHVYVIENQDAPQIKWLQDKADE